jgi:hypothetical protein
MRWLKKDLQTCGLDLKRISDLPGKLDGLINVRLEISKRKKDDNENICFNRRVLSSREDENGLTTDVDVPFLGPLISVPEPCPTIHQPEHCRERSGDRDQVSDAIPPPPDEIRNL